jgi:hypothetical protein
MRVFKYFLFLTSILFNVIYSFGKDGINFADQDSTTLTKNVRSYTVTKLETPEPNIDGVLDDPCWKTGEWAGNFTQWFPKEKGIPSQKTELKILYDEENIYVAIRAYDKEPEKILLVAGRRDEQVGDVVGVTFDSYHDHRTGFEFDVTAAGQKMDLILTNPMNADFNWNAVWYCKAGLEDSAWIAEMKIPLSQLRFSVEDVQTWGLHCWRWIDRLKEEDDWEVQEQNTAGMLYLFGHLNGIKGLKKNSRIELTPYILGKLNTFQKETGNPYRKDGRSWLGNGGLDGKIGLSSSFTFNFTINPDFGQVEADPSIMNLTAFETFFEEKRPFFLEGKNIFDFGFDDLNAFYTRRIGHSASYYPGLNSNEYLKMPEKATILDAVKLSGKTADGFSIGVIQSLTSDEFALINNSERERTTTVEPMTNYLVGRVQKDFNEGSTIVGGILTTTNRFIKDDYLNYMNKGAYTGGLDLLHYWSDKEFYVNAKVVGSFVEGDRNAMMSLQTSSARYYQRPDAVGIHLDSSLTSLSGHGGKIIFGKASKGLWKYSTSLSWRSPGLELNDIGFMQTADLIKQANSISFSINEPTGILNTFSTGISESNNWNYGGEFLSSSIGGSISFGFTNNWNLSNDFSYNTANINTRLLRGGFAMKLPSSLNYNLSISSDNSRNIYFSSGLSFQHAAENSSENISYQAGINFRPMNTLYLSLNTSFSKNTDNLQYVSTINYSDKAHYLLGRLEQETLGLTFRIDWNITPELSILYYGSPFVAVGSYSEFKNITNPRAENYKDRFAVYNSKRTGTDVILDENSDGKPEAALANPDFSFSQFRSNLVFRWEYKPGSQLYIVWASDLTNFNSSKTSLSEAVSDLSRIFPNNIFLVKFNYWFSI